MKYGILFIHNSTKKACLKAKKNNDYDSVW